MSRVDAIADVLSGGLPDPSALLDTLGRAIPLVGRMALTPQDPEWHGEGNVRIHTEMVLRETYALLDSAEAVHLSQAKRAALVLGAALHDVGKALATREELREGRLRIISPRHARLGRSHVALREEALGLPRPIFDDVLALIGFHHDPHSLVRKESPEHRYTRLARLVDLELVRLLEIADLRGRVCADRDAPLEELDYFRLSAEEFGVWRQPPYSGWHGRIQPIVGTDNAEALDYLFLEARRQFEDGDASVPEAAVARVYAHRESHGLVTLTCGLSGAGKSLWISENLAGHEVISLDEIRREITGKAGDQSRNGRVLQEAKARLKDALRRKVRVVWDATCLRVDGRAMVLDLAHAYHARTRIVTFPVSLETASRRNRDRREMIPTSILERQAARMEWPTFPEAHEVLRAEAIRSRREDGAPSVPAPPPGLRRE